MLNNPKAKWIIGAALFSGFLLSLWLDLTGLAVHQWLGMAVGALAVYHLAAHWRWVVAVTERFFGRTSQQARTFYMVDAGLAAGFALILITGLAISTWLDLSLAGYAAWHSIHVIASIVTLALVVIKIGLHGRWIVNTARRHFLTAAATQGRAAKAQPAPVATPMNRRDFVQLMAGVGAVALLAGLHAAGSLQENQVEAGAASAADSTHATSSTATRRASTSTTACTVRCQRRCSYPGHCRRYTDSNGNGRCDLGECLS